MVAPLSKITAVLGPTNTGKTHYAIERMLGHSTGIIGFPLRLLARENYDRIVRDKGINSVALVTGEERIVPKAARWFCCTVEAMSLDRPFAFLAIDEVQLAADPERGHVFTDRLLHARGQEETLFLGAETIRPLIRRLVPEAEHETRTRFSQLTYKGSRKLSRLPPRSAIVAFSAAEVYTLAEAIRHCRGGTAVVLGALSPRTRNAQVALFQNGEVDYLIATDAIGMGLNMDIDHVAFASLTKFDGYRTRQLTVPEIGQIAGRAGRHMNNGTFGITADVQSIDDESIRRVEMHEFGALHGIYWRNSALNFISLPQLIASLELRPPQPELMRAPPANDLATLNILAKEPEIAQRAHHQEGLRLLWEVCQIPDYRKTLSEAHARLLTQLFLRLTDPTGSGQLSEDWIANQMQRYERTDGDVETLMGRIAHIRTWTYVTHRDGWINDVVHWRETARQIEDKLSDALHERLTERFVDRRAAILVRHLAAGNDLIGTVTKDDAVLVEGEYIGQISGFSFYPDTIAVTNPEDGSRRALMRAARRILAREVSHRLMMAQKEPDQAYHLKLEKDDMVQIYWRNTTIAQLRPGANLLTPRITLPVDSLLDGGEARQLIQHLEGWLKRHLRTKLKPLFALTELKALSPAGRGFAFQLFERLGAIALSDATIQISQLTSSDRKIFNHLGIRFGAHNIYLSPLLKPEALRLKALLWVAAYPSEGLPLSVFSTLGQRVSFILKNKGATVSEALFWNAVGYYAIGPLALRFDIAERLAAMARQRGYKGAFAVDPPMLSLARCSPAEMDGVLLGLGFRRKTPNASFSDQQYLLSRRAIAGTARSPSHNRKTLRQEARIDPSHPFAALKNLLGR
ncbi:MAG: helicase-related protein [Alphaproteobacteria bacterium]